MAEPTSAEETVGHYAKEFIKFLKGEVAKGDLSAKRWGNLRNQVMNFVDWIKPATQLNSINADSVRGYYEYMRDDERMGNSTKQESIGRRSGDFFAFGLTKASSPNLPTLISQSTDSAEK